MSDNIKIRIFLPKFLIDFKIDFFDIIFICIFSQMIDLFCWLFDSSLPMIQHFPTIIFRISINCMSICTSKDRSLVIMIAILFFICRKIVCFIERICFFMWMMSWCFFHIAGHQNCDYGKYSYFFHIEPLICPWWVHTLNLPLITWSWRWEAECPRSGDVWSCR